MLFRGSYILSWIILASSITQCASKSEEQQDEVEASADENQTSEESSSNETEMTEENGANGSEDSADAEISAGDETVAADETSANIPQEATTDETATMATTPEATDSVPTQSTQVASTPSVGNSGFQVFYVGNNGAKLLDSPSESGNAIGTLEKGDHILVSIEGNWAKTSKGNFIRLSDLSMKAVGRKLATNDWK